MTVRAKFTLAAIRETTWTPNGAKSTELEFQTQYDTSIPEDQRFSKATPSGNIKVQIDNPKALEQFVVGQSYYVDFTHAPKPEAAK